MHRPAPTPPDNDPSGRHPASALIARGDEDGRAAPEYRQILGRHAEDDPTAVGETRCRSLAGRGDHARVFDEIGRAALEYREILGRHAEDDSTAEVESWCRSFV